MKQLAENLPRSFLGFKGSGNVFINSPLLLLATSLSTEKIQDKKPEIYYNIASSYAKLRNKVAVTKYLRLLKQEFPNSEWVKRSEALTK